jgi:hypothetical protein
MVFTLLRSFLIFENCVHTVVEGQGRGLEKRDLRGTVRCYVHDCGICDEMPRPDLLLGYDDGKHMSAVENGGQYYREMGNERR